MIKILLVTIVILQTGVAFAQDNGWVTPQQTTDELGLMAQTQMGGENSGLALLGIQYKKWKSEHLGYRVSASIGNYHDFGGGTTTQYASDTVYTSHQQVKINMAVLGAGIEAQRRFYGKVYLFAALELKLGYGTGREDSVVDKQSLGFDTYNLNSSTIQGDRNMSAFYMGLSPSIGAKLQFKHLCIGAEIVPAEVSFRSMQPSNGSFSNSSDMAIGNIAEKLFVHYCF